MSALIRLSCACLFAGLILLSTCASAVLMPSAVQIHTINPDGSQGLSADNWQHNQNQQRDLTEERHRSLQLRDSIADRSQAEEALKTLDLIQHLHQQEARLWTYYDALHNSAETRQSMLEKRLDLERLLREQKKAEEKINHQLQVLQPETANSIQFAD